MNALRTTDVDMATHAYYRSRPDSIARTDFESFLLLYPRLSKHDLETMIGLYLRLTMLDMATILTDDNLTKIMEMFKRDHVKRLGGSLTPLIVVLTILSFVIITAVVQKIGIFS